MQIWPRCDNVQLECCTDAYGDTARISLDLRGFKCSLPLLIRSQTAYQVRRSPALPRMRKVQILFEGEYYFVQALRSCEYNSRAKSNRGNTVRLHFCRERKACLRHAAIMPIMNTFVSVSVTMARNPESFGSYSSLKSISRKNDLHMTRNTQR